ncbi:Unconventional myosin-Ig [Perkinsus chesapeaki]|uniref:Unconventional myosin-Ig n=1 Tax=Perkinsus chesapeaki TaxID=330153 RepID=A0A7J6MZV9_PERCH|nr:Unconventional myosin-Ig [Perkinsus chesapeaki]
MCNTTKSNNVIVSPTPRALEVDEPKAQSNACPSTIENGGLFSPKWYHSVYPHKAATRADPIMVKLLAQVRDLSETEFEGENCLDKISGRSPWKLSILANGDQLCAFIVYKFVNDRRAFSIAKLAVPKTMRGKGMGTFVMKWVKDSCKANPNVDIVTLSSLPAAIKFYKKLGFKKIYMITQNDPDEELVEGQAYMELNVGVSLSIASLITVEGIDYCPRSS